MRMFKHTPTYIPFNPKSRTLSHSMMVYNKPSYDSVVQDWADSYLSDPNHLLICGSTGCGKSVTENTLLYYSFLRGDSKYIFIDIKKVELFQYKNIAPCRYYANDNLGVNEALTIALDIMDSRYARMMQEGIKTYKGENLFIVIDEVADLLQGENKKNFYSKLLKIAQLGRAAKVFLIVCTQNSKRDLLKDIKNNFGTVIGLHTLDATASRNLIGSSGCELLTIGRGLMLTNTIRNITINKVDDRLIRELLTTL
ncbi:MAG: hypothetical protein MJ126_05770 [Lachnospiraceae bacterium]|nr:hypothetical protein [Lachnospiraceae bacterium]